MRQSDNSGYTGPRKHAAAPNPKIWAGDRVVDKGEMRTRAKLGSFLLAVFLDG